MSFVWPLRIQLRAESDPTTPSPINTSATESETKYMTASKIAARFAPYMKINPTKIGLALADLGFEQIRRKNGRFWKVAERPQVDIDSRIPDVDHSENVETDAPFWGSSGDRVTLYNIENP